MAIRPSKIGNRVDGESTKRERIGNVRYPFSFLFSIALLSLTKSFRECRRWFSHEQKLYGQILPPLLSWST